jgi:hypothetical protein
MSKEEKAQAAAAGADSGTGTRAPSNAPAAKVAFTRRFPRFTLDVRLQVKMFQAGEFRSCWGRSTEMGQDGIGATLTGSLEPIKVRAIVRYRQGLRYGFEFLTLNDGQRDTIHRVCEYLATKA